MQSIVLRYIIRGILIFLFSILLGQNSLDEQMKELNRLQAKLESMQENENIKSEKNQNIEHITDHGIIIGRYQLINMDYKSTVHNTNTITILKGPIKIDTVTGETWRYVVKGYEEYWKKIED